MGLLSGPDDVFAARPRRLRAWLMPLFGLLLGALLAAGALHWIGAWLPAWPWLRPAIVIAAAVGGAALVLRLDRRPPAARRSTPPP